MTALIRLSDILARATGFYYNRDFKGIKLEDDPGWKILTKDKVDPENLIVPILDDAEQAIIFAEIAWGRL